MNYTYNDNELYHYGVLGMKWGVRHDRAREAYSKGVRKLQKYEQKAAKSKAKVTASAMAKAAKYNRKAKKYEMKSARVKRAATRWILPMNSEKAARRMGRYDLKAARYANKSARIMSRIAKNQAKSEKYNRKGEKFYSKMQKVFSDVPASSLNAADISFAKEYAKNHGLS